MLRSRSFLAAVVIVLLAAALRFYQLAEVPHGMTWDEAAIGYNSYALWNTRRDEWLVRFPVSFRSFGDYKAPFAIYLLSPLTGLIDLNLWILRLPFALAGVMAVVGMILLTDLVFSIELKPGTESSHRSLSWYAVGAGFFLATSPWHLHYSRLGFESGLALTFVIWAVWFWLKWLTLESQSWEIRRQFYLSRASWYLLMSAGLFGASIYTYHSAKAVAPALVILLLGIWWRKAKRLWLQIVVFLGLLTASLWPLISDSMTGQGSERFNQASILAKGLPLTEVMATVWRQFWLHFQPGFLIFGETPTLRHGDGTWGVLFITTYLLVIVGFLAGIGVLLRYVRGKSAFAQVRIPLLSLAWIILGILPAAIGVDVPHSNRALLALPGFILLAIWGWKWLSDWLSQPRFNRLALGTHGEDKTLAKICIGLVILIQSLLLIKHQQHYYKVFAGESADEFKDGYLEAMKYAITYERGLDGVQEVDQILFSSKYGQAYIYALFARKTNPIYYQGGSLIKYLFLDNLTEADLNRRNVLVVASASDPLPVEAADHLVYGSDGQVRFKLYVRR